MNEILKYFTEFNLEQLKQFEALHPLYKEWNKKINVISRKDMENFYVHHVLHSLAIASQFDFPAGSQIMDLGTGGGFPGIPLAICFPEVHFHLVDSINKKLQVVEAIAGGIDLKNVTTQHSRAEDIHDRRFDVVLSRAVAPLKDLWGWSKPLLKKKLTDQRNKNSGLICLKGGELSHEILESHTRPRIREIDKIFEEPFFKEKFILQVSSQ